MDEEPMSRLQFVAVTLCILLYALDGFDVLSISFAAPGIADKWGIDRATLGVFPFGALITTVFNLPVRFFLPDRTGTGELFRPEMPRIAILLTLAYFAHIVTLYTNAGAGLALVAAIMSIGSVVAAIAVIALGHATPSKVAAAECGDRSS